MERGFVRNLEGKQEVIFIHLPKTGGSSVSKALRQCKNFEIVPSVQTYSWENFSRKIRGIPKPARHAYARQIKSIMKAKRWNSSFSFAFVRNPWDLMVSAYVFLYQKGSSYAKLEKYSEQIKKMDNFSEFMKSDFGQYQILEYKGNMRDWLCDDNQKILVNFVGKLENFKSVAYFFLPRQLVSLYSFFLLSALILIYYLFVLLINLLRKSISIKMKINYKNYYFLLPINLILVNLFSLNIQQLTQAQTTKPTVNQQQCVNNLVKEGLENNQAIVWCDYQEECLELSQEEGLPLYAAQNVCDCTIKEFRNRYTAEKFKELNKQAETDEEVENNLREVGESCFEDILFAD